MHEVLCSEELLEQIGFVASYIATHVFFEDLNEEEDCKGEGGVFSGEVLVIEWVIIFTFVLQYARRLLDFLYIMSL